MIQMIGLIVAVYAFVRLVTFSALIPRPRSPQQSLQVAGCFIGAVIIGLLALELLLGSAAK